MMGLTARQLDEYSILQHNSGLTGTALVAKYQDSNSNKSEFNGAHAWTAIKPTIAKSELREIIYDEYPSESEELYSAVIDLYMESKEEWKDLRVLLPTSRNKERIRTLLMIHQIRLPRREEYLRSQTASQKFRRFFIPRKQEATHDYQAQRQSSTYTRDA